MQQAKTWASQIAASQIAVEALWSEPHDKEGMDREFKSRRLMQAASVQRCTTTS